MTNITRRDALLGASGALGGAAVLLAEKGAVASPVQDPLVCLWQERARLRAQLDRIRDQCDAIEKTLPEWARNFDGITIQVTGCKPRTCRTVEQIDAVMSRRGLFSLDPPSKEAVSAWRAEGKVQRDTWVVELERARQRFDRERDRAGYTAKHTEYEAMNRPVARAPQKATKMPTCAAAPSSSVLGLAITGLKSVIAPSPRKMIGGRMSQNVRP